MLPTAAVQTVDSPLGPAGPEATVTAVALPQSEGEAGVGRADHGSQLYHTAVHLQHSQQHQQQHGPLLLVQRTSGEALSVLPLPGQAWSPLHHQVLRLLVWASVLPPPTSFYVSWVLLLLTTSS